MRRFQIYQHFFCDFFVLFFGVWSETFENHSSCSDAHQRVLQPWNPLSIAVHLFRNTFFTCRVGFSPALTPGQTTMALVSQSETSHVTPTRLYESLIRHWCQHWLALVTWCERWSLTRWRALRHDQNKSDIIAYSGLPLLGLFVSL